jgi:hypothetical protein
MECHPIGPSFQECTAREINTKYSREQKERQNIKKKKAEKRKRILSGISETN